MSLVKVESSEGITTITMMRPEKRNALTQELCDGLYEAYRAFEEGDDLVAVLQADGPAFCVGADLTNPPAAMSRTRKSPTTGQPKHSASNASSPSCRVLRWRRPRYSSSAGICQRVWP